VQNLIFIGDVHGRNDKLTSFIRLHQANDSQFVFVGDLIDNSLDEQTDHLSSLQTVRHLCETGEAVCLMGNHELNAIGWSLRKADGSYCRSRTKLSNQKQHRNFLEAVVGDSEEHQYWIEWFKTLPLFADFENVRAIHACWDDQFIEQITRYLNSDYSLKPEYWYQAFDEQYELCHLMDALLKGPELDLPDGYHFFDKTVIMRKQIRIAWWHEPVDGLTYRDIALLPEDARHQIPHSPIPQSANQQFKVTDKLTIVGHYTLAPTEQHDPIGHNVVCVDYNAAKSHHPLVGYHLDLDSKMGHFVTSSTVSES